MRTSCTGRSRRAFPLERVRLLEHVDALFDDAMGGRHDEVGGELPLEHLIRMRILPEVTA